MTDTDGIVRDQHSHIINGEINEGRNSGETDGGVCPECEAGAVALTCEICEQTEWALCCPCSGSVSRMQVYEGKIYCDDCWETRPDGLREPE